MPEQHSDSDREDDTEVHQPSDSDSEDDNEKFEILDQYHPRTFEDILGTLPATKREMVTNSMHTFAMDASKLYHENSKNKRVLTGYKKQQDRVSKDKFIHSINEIKAHMAHAHYTSRLNHLMKLDYKSTISNYEIDLLVNYLGMQMAEHTLITDSEKMTNELRAEILELKKKCSLLEHVRLQQFKNIERLQDENHRLQQQVQTKEKKKGRRFFKWS